jgi:hypothetical protein
MNARVAVSCSRLPKVIVVCIVHTVTPGARLFNGEAIAAPEDNPVAVFGSRKRPIIQFCSSDPERPVLVRLKFNQHERKHSNKKLPMS